MALGLSVHGSRQVIMTPTVDLIEFMKDQKALEPAFKMKTVWSYFKNMDKKTLELYAKAKAVFYCTVGKDATWHVRA